MKRLLFLVLVLGLVSLACGLADEIPNLPTLAPPPTQETPASPVAVGEVPVEVGYGYAGSFYEIYFTDPFDRAANMEEGGPDEFLAQAIDQARLSVDLAVYSFSLTSIRDALLRAHDRGVQVRIVMETDSLDRPVPEALMAQGLEIVGDQREGLMHNKFVVIDRAEVWLGSMNFTTSGAYEDNNSLVRIRSTRIAENYSLEFEEMFNDDFFGPDVVAETPNPVVTVDGTQVEVLFSPDDKPAIRIAEVLRSAESSIYFMAYSFTADDFADILLQKELGGVRVSGVMEEEQVKSNQGTEFETFSQNRLPVYIDGNLGQMHHKVFIVDEKIVIFGSYNFSASAEKRNDENVMIVFDPQFAAQFLAEFQRVLAEARK
jgi:phosphatidylserine/phosphatidylglycerophosphate/cardiolipin synthase-like enzyme